MSIENKPVKAARGWLGKGLLVFAVLLVAGCAMYASENWDEMFGPAEPRQRMVAADTEVGHIYLDQVQPILEQRCVVCHGCYDAPCQLNLAAPEGVDRGASKEVVYRGGRLSEAQPTRLLEDAQTTAEWREMGFFPVLNEHEQSKRANREASLMVRLLELKQQHPLPDVTVLPKSFSFGTYRKQVCPRPEDTDKFVAQNPLWGMPYGLPGLSEAEYNTLDRWLEQGAQMALPPPIGAAAMAEVERWEQFLNGDSAKQQLMARYLYEHWFLAHLYFPALNVEDFFRVVRSASPPGQPIELITTRRPYEDPGVERVYYRLWRDHSTVLDKTHMPYALDEARMSWLQGLFLDADYEVEELPAYTPEVASNPFIAFSVIPIDSRWRFLLAEAQFTIMNFIKGPVCRGQTALNVIRDHFWVFFDNPDLIDLYPEQAAAFLNSQEANLSMPAAAGSSALPVKTWNKYAKLQNAYLEAKSELLNQGFPDGRGVDLDLIWDGDGVNPNAALTVFRHFDSASIVKGLVGKQPKTAWVVDYPILERIHYLLVAGFDVYGNMGHQLTTRLYMDFLRMEGEFNFLSLLPAEDRREIGLQWYEGASKKEQSYVYGSRADFELPSNIDYQTDDPVTELFGLLKQRLAPVLNRSYDLDQPSVPAAHRQALERLAALRGLTLQTVPQVVFVNVRGSDGANYSYTVLHNSSHTNVTSLFREGSDLVPENDSLTVVRGFIGSYPGAFWQLEEENLEAWVDDVAALTDEESYTRLMDRYGVRRTAPDFWQHSDQVMSAHYRDNPVENGLLDYNRLENR